jgi:glycosyltransferase involved in cell wall biosynthesis
MSYRAAAEALGGDFDGIVLVHNEPSGVEVIARRCPNAKVCLWVHNDLFRTYTRRQSCRVVHHSHRIICVSNFIANTVRAKTGEDPKIVTVLNGVDTEKFVPAVRPPDNDPPVILFLGRILPEKGPDILLRAAIQLKKKGIRFKLRVVGSQNFNAADHLTGYEAKLRQLAKDLGDSIDFQAFKPRDQVVREYQSADILCVPSNWDEPLGLVASEGMACGLACVVSNRGGLPEIGGDAVKYFCPPDADQLASRLCELAADPETRSRLGTTARKHSLSIAVRQMTFAGMKF